MSIIKNTPNFLKHSDLPFTTLINKTLEIIENPATLGIYVYLSSKPSDWEISCTNLQNRFKKGRDFIKKCLAELRQLRLLKSISFKNDKGLITHWETVLYNEPFQVTENPSSGEDPLLDCEVDEKPGYWKSSRLEKPPTTNKRIKEIKDKILTPPTPFCGGVENPIEEEEKTDPLFETFWTLYPIHTAKVTCKKKWKSRGLAKIAHMIIDKVKTQIENDDRWKRGFIPNPLTYLNQSRWEDEIIKPKFTEVKKYSASQETLERALAAANFDSDSNISVRFG